MAYIYKITNQINGKVYIGKTLSTIEGRFKEHLKGENRIYTQHRPLYDAMKQYGSENFIVEEIEKCTATQASEREMY